MDDRDITRQLAAAIGVTVDEDQLRALYAIAPELTEWSVNPGGDRRGELRVSTWTRDRPAAAAAVTALAALAPSLVATRRALVGDDVEGLGLAFRAAGPVTARWWGTAADGERMAARVREAWPHHAAELEGLLEATGGPHTFVAVGVEGEVRQTIYAQLRTPDTALRVLERARVPVTRETNWFAKGLLGLEPGGRPWPKVWAGRSLGTGGGWKLYYFARGDELRRTDEVLLDAISAEPALLDAWKRVRAAQPGHACVQVVALTLPEVGRPSFTAYLARS